VTERPVCVVVGVGPGIGSALAQRFSAEGYEVAVLARTRGKVIELADAIGGTGYPCDVTDPAQIRAVFAQIREELGPVRTLLWNVGSGVWGTIDQIDIAAMESSWRTNTLGAMVAVQEVLPDMRAIGGGEIVFTGATASRRGLPFTTAFASAKAAQRSLAESLARHLWPEGIHVALAVIDGAVDTPAVRERRKADSDEQFVAPSAVADTVLHLCRQDRRGWTFELEVRPAREPW
jgi:NAD(P)-dependent dehydrogenase (short-subunit alcohol dehydrogenase family)